jgi:hypothetical protein
LSDNKRIQIKHVSIETLDGKSEGYRKSIAIDENGREFGIPNTY